MPIAHLSSVFFLPTHLQLLLLPLTNIGSGESIHLLSPVGALVVGALGRAVGVFGASTGFEVGAEDNEGALDGSFE